MTITWSEVSIDWAGPSTIGSLTHVPTGTQLTPDADKAEVSQNDQREELLKELDAKVNPPSD